MARIYALKAGDLVLYVGRTIQTLSIRASHHHSPTNDCTSRYIPDWIEWEIVLLEECADDLGVTREQFYYDTLKPLYNKCRPGQTYNEWRQIYDKTEVRKASQKARRIIYNQSDEVKASKAAYARAYRARKKAQRSP